MPRGTGRDGLLMTAGVWATAVVFVTFLSLGSGQMPSLADFLGMVGGTVTSVLLALLILATFAWLAGRPLLLAVPILAAVVLAIAMAQMACDYGVQFLVKMAAADATLPQTSLPFLARTAFYYLALDTTNAALIWLMASNQEVRERAQELMAARTRAAEAETTAVRAQLRALRLQLNPHYLLNSLNGLRALITSGRTSEADAMVVRLADFLRTTLVADIGGKVPLADEIDTISHYLEVEDIWRGDVHLELDLQREATTLLVPDFILQPLVENALKHAPPRDGALRLSARVAGELLQIELENHCAEVRRAEPGLGIGQSNILARLASFYGEAARLEIDEQPAIYRVRLHLPAERRPARLGANLPAEAADLQAGGRA